MRAGVLAALVLFLLSACGGGDGDGGQARRAVEPDAQARAESVVLKLSDFPDGWRASPPEGDEEEDDEFRECLGVDYSKLTFNGEAESQEFAMGQNTEISSESAVLADEGEAQMWFREYSDALSGDAVEPCMDEFLAESVDEEGFEVGEVDVGELSFSAPDVDEARAWQIAVPIEVTEGTGEGLTVTAYIDFVALRHGETVVSVEASDVLSPFDPELRDRLVEAVADRLTARET